MSDYRAGAVQKGTFARLYDRYLNSPMLFEPYARFVAHRVSGLDPRNFARNCGGHEDRNPGAGPGHDAAPRRSPRRMSISQ